MEYDKMSNMDIQAIHIEMREEFEGIKTQINQLVEKLKTMDIEYLKGKAVLDKRLQR
jgi:regulator of replication initiation timing